MRKVIVLAIFSLFFLSSIALAKPSVYLFSQNITISQNVTYNYEDSLWVNGTSFLYINSSYPGLINTSINCSQIFGAPDNDFCSDANDGGVDTDTWWPITGYIYNNSGSIDVNESMLNATCEALDDDTIITTLPASNITGLTYTSTLPASNITGLAYTTGLPIANITNLIGSVICSGDDKVTNVTVTDSGISVVCSADVDTQATTLPASNITGLTYTTTLPSSNITGLTYTTQLPISNITNLIVSYQCSGTDKVTNVTINSTGLFVTCTADEDSGAITTLPSANITGTMKDTQIELPACPSGQFITQINGSVTCDMPTYTTTLPASNITSLTYTTTLPASNITGLTYTSTLPASNITGLTYTTTLPISNITNLIDSEVCTGTDKVTNVTLTDSGLSIVCSSDETGEGQTTSLPIANITNLVGSLVCPGTDKVTNVTITDSGLSVVCSADVDTIVTTLPASNVTGLTYTSTLPASNITGLTYTTTLPAGNITGLTYTTELPIANITDLIVSYQCSGTDKVSNVTINETGLFVTCTSDSDSGAVTTLPAGNITGKDYSLILDYNNLTGTILITQANITGGITIPSTNVTGITYTTSLPATNITGLAYTTTLPHTNITIGSDWDFDGNNITNAPRHCFDAGCTTYIGYYNATHDAWV